MRQYICDRYGMNLGTISIDPFGNKTVYNMSGQKLGYYDASTESTYDPTGRKLFQGDMSGALLIMYK